MTIIIASWPRGKTIIPESYFKDELSQDIIDYCKKNKITPICFDRNIAVCDNEYYGAFYEKDLEHFK